LSRLELRIPPPVVAGVCALLMGFVPELPFAFPGHRALALALAGLGIALGVAAVVQFKRARTTIHPQDPEKSTALVTSGVYRFTRNPMYLGMLTLLAAWALWLANAAALIVLPLFVGYLNRFQIAPEERALQARFGAAFADYRRAVRRWI